MEAITFENLPAAVSKLHVKLESIEQLLKRKEEVPQQSDVCFDLSGLCDYLPWKPAKSTIYGNIANIPHRKHGKKLFFHKSEIDEWLKSGRKRTVSELQSEADIICPIAAKEELP